MLMEGLRVVLERSDLEARDDGDLFLRVEPCAQLIVYENFCERKNCEVDKEVVSTDLVGLDHPLIRCWSGMM